VLIVLKSGSLNILEPSGSVQALPFYLITSERVDSFDQILCSENFVQICRTISSLMNINSMKFCTGRSAHSGSRGIALLFIDHGTRGGEGSTSRPGRSLPPGKTRYPLYRRLGGPQGQSGQVRKISPSPGFDPRNFQPVANRCTD